MLLLGEHDGHLDGSPGARRHALSATALLDGTWGAQQYVTHPDHPPIRHITSRPLDAERRTVTDPRPILHDDPWLLDEPLPVGGHTLRGRIYIPAHQCGLAEEGKPGRDYIQYHRVRAAAGVAMQLTGATPISPSALWTSGRSLVNIDDSIIPGYQQLTDAVHNEGGTILAQLAHPGPTDARGPDVIGPSRIFSEISRQVTREASLTELDDIVDSFVAAAGRCRMGGLDGIELSLAHGLLLAAFLSPATNVRHDRYGGSLERRLAFPLRVLTAVRQAIGPELILGVRLVADDLIPDGFGPAEAIRAAQELDSYVDYISVIAGNNNRLEARVRHWPPSPAPRGLFRGLAGAIRQAVSVPVCAVGRVTTPLLANDILVQGDADLVGMVRAHIADPELVSKARSRRFADIRPCVGCNFCISEDLAGRPVRCSVNPRVSHPDWEPRGREGHSPRVVVVGAGVAGLEAARRAASQGCRVVLLERTTRLGGQTYTWSTASSRAEFRDFLHWEERQLTSHGVEMRLGEEGTAAAILQLEPDAVIVATGSLPDRGALRTDGTVPILDPLGALLTPPTGKVVVYDTVGSLDGALIAERVAEAGPADVSLVTSRLHVGEGDDISSIFPMLRRLAELRVRVIERAVVRQLEEGRVDLDGVFGEPRDPLPAAVVVPWLGGVSQASIAHDLRAQGFEAMIVGDALRPRRVADAVEDSLDFVQRLLSGITAVPRSSRGKAMPSSAMRESSAWSF